MASGEKGKALHGERHADDGSGVFINVGHKRPSSNDNTVHDFPTAKIMAVPLALLGRFPARPVARSSAHFHSAMTISRGMAMPTQAKMMWKARDMAIWPRAARRFVGSDLRRGKAEAMERIFCGKRVRAQVLRRPRQRAVGDHRGRRAGPPQEQVRTQSETKDLQSGPRTSL